MTRFVSNTAFEQGRPGAAKAAIAESGGGADRAGIV